MIDAEVMTPERYANLIRAAGIRSLEEPVEDLKIAYISGPCIVPRKENPDSEFLMLIPDTFPWVDEKMWLQIVAAFNNHKEQIDD